MIADNENRNISLASYTLCVAMRYFTTSFPHCTSLRGCVAMQQREPNEMPNSEASKHQMTCAPYIGMR